MTFRDDFGLFWGGVLGTLAVCWLVCYVRRQAWDDFTRLGTMAALVYVSLYLLAYGVP